jgi:hypothetical protein
MGYPGYGNECPTGGGGGRACDTLIGGATFMLGGTPTDKELVLVTPIA